MKNFFEWLGTEAPKFVQALWGIFVMAIFLAWFGVLLYLSQRGIGWFLVTILSPPVIGLIVTIYEYRKTMKQGTFRTH